MSTAAPGRQASSSAVPITIRAALAADCSNLPRELRHFVHVLALHATYRTGRGLAGQATLARYMGLGRVQVSRLWARLDALWEAQQSPVGALREARHHTSDAYQLVIADGAPTKLPELQSRRNDSSVAGVIVASEKVDVASADVGVASRETRCDSQGNETPPQCSAQGSISSQKSLRSDLLRRRQDSALPLGLAAGAREGAAPRSPEVAPRITAAALAARWGAELARRPDEDGMAHSRRIGGLRKILAAELQNYGPRS